ncbi:MAG: response regulator [bacterium]|nr:response regulator [Gammaproteobacteria bacterium]
MSEPTLNKVLIVEDDPDIREVVRMTLEMIGELEVAACDSCAEALVLVDEFKPDLLLLDVMMPIIDGPTTLRLLRERTSTKNTPAIFLTAKIEAGDMAQYKNLGVLDVIIKPFDPLLLPDKLGEIWVRHHGIDKGDGHEEFIRQFEQTSAAFITQLPQEIQTLMDELSAYRKTGESAFLNRLRQKVHRLKGTGSTFGCNAITDLSRKLEQSLARLHLDDATVAEPVTLDEIESQIEALRDEADRVFREFHCNEQPGINT